MIYGLDTVSNVSSIVNSIRSQGYSFVIRYYSLSANAKRTSPAEIAAIGNAGLKRVVVYQNLRNAYSKFSESIAANDAADAIAQARNVGQPSSVIYFAVDYDASSSEIEANIKAHFRKLSTLLPQAGYSVGVYGSRLVCKRLKDANLVSATWVATPNDWGVGTVFNNWNIHQLGGVSIGSVQFDMNEASSLSVIGGW